MEEKGMYSIEKVSDLLNVSKRSIYRWIESGKLEAVKVGRQWRISSNEVEHILNEGTREGSG